MAPDGKVLTQKFGEAAKLIAPVYEWIFGPGMVANHLKDDILGHAGGVVSAASEDPDAYRTVDGMVSNMLKRKNIGDIRGKWGEGIVEVLWTKRALDFILRFLNSAMLIDTQQSLSHAASVAYAEVLKPYHGFMVSSIVTLAFKLAPSRKNFIRTLGFSDLAHAQETLRGFLVSAQPVVAKVHQVLTQHNCDFDDKV